MISYGAPFGTRRAPIRRPATVAMARTAGIAGVVLALASAAVPVAGAATVPSSGGATVSAPPAQAARSTTHILGPRWAQEEGGELR
jgi:hypothetical protein